MCPFSYFAEKKKHQLITSFELVFFSFFNFEEKKKRISSAVGDASFKRGVDDTHGVGGAKPMALFLSP